MRILTYIFVLLTFGTTAQELNLRVNFEDAMTNSSIDSVEVLVLNTSSSILKKDWIQNGDIINFEIPDNQIIKIRAEKSGYLDLDTLINLSYYQRDIKRNKIISILLMLTFDGQTSSDFDISGIYKPKVAFSSEELSVSDFVVIDDSTMVLLTYPKRLNAGSELIWFRNDSVISRKKAPEKAIRLDVDYRKRIYLRCEYSDYILEDETFLNLVSVSRDQLDNYVRPILDTLINEQLFFTTYKYHYPAFDFFKVHMKDTSHKLLHHIEDTEMMEFYRAEYKWADVRTRLWAWDKEVETGIDREIWVGANVFTNSIYYESPYSELFLVEDEVYIFDFYKNHLFRYDANSGEKLDSLPVNFHLNPRKSGWERRMLQDPITKTIYTFYDEAGYTHVYAIDLYEGKAVSKFNLHYRYVENIQIFNNEVYYIYRPFESAQKKYLYKEKLNFEAEN